MDLDEASTLFKTVRSLERPLGVEIGRFKGGSTFLIASALKPGGRLLSIDLHSALSADGVKYDDELVEALRKVGRAQNVELIVADNRTYPNAALSLDFLFIDGDHSYEGVKQDFEHWAGTLKVGGHLLFHDDRPEKPGVWRFLRELEGRKDSGLQKVRTVGSVSHFVRSAPPPRSRPAA